MTIRTQLPAWSPVSGSIIARGVLQALQGEAAQRLGALIRTEYGADRVVLTDSGTAALTIALRSLGPTPTVALPAYGCFDLATAAIGAGAKVRLYDVDPGTLGPDDRSITAAIDAGIDALVLAHLYGIPAAPGPWRELVRERGVVVIDDAAQAVGATLGGRPAGSLGDLGVLSFGRGKGRTGGGGGALMGFTATGTRLLDGVAEPALPGASLGAQGAAAAKLMVQWLLGRPSLYGLPASIPWLGLGQTHFKPPKAATGVGGLAAAVLLSAWEASAAEVAVRRSNAETWMNIDVAAGLRRTTIAPTAKPGWLRFPVLVSPERRAGFETRSARQLGIAPGYPTSLGDLAGFGDRVLPAGDLAGAVALAGALVTLPTHGLLSDADRRSLTRLLSG